MTGPNSTEAIYSREPITGAFYSRSGHGMGGSDLINKKFCLFLSLKRAKSALENIMLSARRQSQRIMLHDLMKYPTQGSMETG